MKKQTDLSAVEACRHAHMRLDVLYPLMRVGRIKARKVDGRWVIAMADLDAYLKWRDARYGAPKVEAPAQVEARA